MLIFSLLALLLGGAQLIWAVPQPLVPRQSSAVLPTKVSCADCYALDATWTVAVSSMTIEAAATEVGNPTTTATVMGVISDGVFHWPPPEVTATVNKRIRITLVNNLETKNYKDQREKVTLHFHGLYQENGYGLADGPESITQCGVEKQDTFIYDFPVTRAGTYWIHSHDPGQYPKGLRTPLIIKDSQDSVYASDNTVTVSDWYPDFWSTEKIYRLKKPLNGAYEGCGNGVEVLGPHFAATFNDYIPGLHILKKRSFEVKTGKNRFRFINLSAFSPFYIKFEEHSVKVIELDGVLINESEPTEGFSVMPGQRISVSLEPKPGIELKKAYRIVAAIDPRFVPDGQGTNCRLPNKAIGVTSYTWGYFYAGSKPEKYSAPDPAEFPFLNYKLDTPKGKPREHLTLNLPWNWDLHTPVAYPWNYNEKALSAKSDEPGADRSALVNPKKNNVHFLYIKDYQKARDDDNAGYGSINLGTVAEELWVPPSTPGLLRALQGAADDSIVNKASWYGQNSNTIIVENENDVVWFLIHTKNGDHPMHLHGHHFQLLYRGFEDDASIAKYRAAVDAYNNSPGSSVPESWTNFRAAVELVTPARPVTRDTLLAQNNQFMIIAFKADNPGVWALHCHNDFHASSGMMKQIVVAPKALRKNIGTWTVHPDLAKLQFKKPEGGIKDQAVVEMLLRNVHQCNTALALPDDGDWH